MSQKEELQSMYVKKFHYASYIRHDGAVSALCFNPPRAINLKVALWTTDKSAVTCKKCMMILQEESRKASDPESEKK